jgi:hypothetical protein
MIQSATMGYLSDSQVQLSTPARISKYEMAASLPDTLSVERTGTWVVPLLLFNYWKHAFLVRIGNENISPALSVFGSRSLAKALEKATAGAGNGPEIKVGVRISEVKSELVYEKVGYGYTLLLVNIYGSSHIAKNIRSAIKAEIVLQKADVVDILTFEHEETAMMPPQVAKSDLDATGVNAMAETLSLCFKAMNTRILTALSETSPTR